MFIRMIGYSDIISTNKLAEVTLKLYHSINLNNDTASARDRVCLVQDEYSDLAACQV